jgi:hypothetical protein
VIMPHCLLSTSTPSAPLEKQSSGRADASSPFLGLRCTDISSCEVPGESGAVTRFLGRGEDPGGLMSF